MIRFTRDELLALRKPTRLMPEMAQIPHVISVEPLDPASGKPLEPEEVERQWGRMKGEWSKTPCHFQESGVESRGAYHFPRTRSLYRFAAWTRQFRHARLNTSCVCGCCQVWVVAVAGPWHRWSGAPGSEG